MNSNQLALYYAKQGDSLWKIAKTLFDLNSDAAIARKTRELVELNPHLTSPDYIQAGQLLYLGGDSCPSKPSAFDIGESQLAINSVLGGQDFFLDNFSHLQWLGEELENPNFPGFLGNINYTPHQLASDLGPNYQAKQSSFEKIVKPISSAAELTLETIIHGTTGTFGLLKKVPNHSLSIVEGEIVRGIQKHVRHIPQIGNATYLVPKGFRAIQGKGRVLLVNPGHAQYSSIYKSIRQARVVGQTIERYSKINIGIKLGIIGVATEAAFAGGKIYDAMGTPAQGETIARQVPKSVTGVGLGLGVGMGAGALASFVGGPLGIMVFVSVVVMGGIATNGISTGAGELSAEVFYGTGKGLTIDDFFF